MSADGRVGNVSPELQAWITKVNTDGNPGKISPKEIRSAVQNLFGGDVDAFIADARKAGVNSEKFFHDVRAGSTQQGAPRCRSGACPGTADNDWG